MDIPKICVSHTTLVRATACALSMWSVSQREKSLRCLLYMRALNFIIIEVPLHNVTYPSSTMSTNISIALAATYLYHSLLVPALPPLKGVNLIVIQNASPHAPWSCGTIAIFTILYLTPVHVHPDSINISSISKPHIPSIFITLAHIGHTTQSLDS